MDAAMVALVLPSTAAYRWFKKRGQWEIGARIFLFSTLPAVAVVPFLIPEVTLVISIAYLMLVIISNRIFGKKGWYFNLVCIILFILDLAVTYIWKPVLFTPFSQTLQTLAATSFSLILSGTCMITISQMLYKQDDLSVDAQLARMDIEDRIQVEREQRRKLQETVSQYIQFMACVGKGDLEGRIPLQSNIHSDQDPLTILGRQLNETTANLQQMITQLRTAGANLSSSAAEIQAATTQQASGASEQSAAISETTTTVDEVRTIAEQVSL
ncbi:MAG: hypothetical protein EHM70_20315, partial [Chloroflexota bacterium]